MDGYDETTYGDRFAEVYDEWYSPSTGFDPASCVELLARLAGGGRALELGIGTGRVAVPLAARGVDVGGIDSSDAMVARLRAKPGGDRIHVHRGDFADVDVEGHFALVYVPFSTFFVLPSQDVQIRCLANVASHLQAGGHFVMDAFVPDPARYGNYQESTQTLAVEAGHVLLDVSQHDPVTQEVKASHVMITESGIRLFPMAIRYCWPSELDVMARLAGLTLVDRFGGYEGEPFDSASTRHVSIFRTLEG